MTGQALAPYAERLAQAVAEVRQAIAEKRPYRMMDISYRHSVFFNELREELQRQGDITGRLREKR